MEKTGLTKLLNFLNILQDLAIEYRIDRQSQDSIMVSCAFPGKRLEVEFSEDGLQYSVFSGDESVQVNEGMLYESIKKWAD